MARKRIVWLSGPILNSPMIECLSELNPNSKEYKELYSAYRYAEMFCHKFEIEFITKEFPGVKLEGFYQSSFGGTYYAKLQVGDCHIGENYFFLRVLKNKPKTDLKQIDIEEECEVLRKEMINVFREE